MTTSTNLKTYFENKIAKLLVDLIWTGGKPPLVKGEVYCFGDVALKHYIRSDKTIVTDQYEMNWNNGMSCFIVPKGIDVTLSSSFVFKRYKSLKKKLKLLDI